MAYDINQCQHKWVVESSNTDLIPRDTGLFHACRQWLFDTKKTVSTIVMMSVNDYPVVNEHKEH